jgi:hypothetical protein
MAVIEKICVNELLCFLTRKCNLICVDKLVAICANYFTWDEISKARAVLVSDKEGVLGQRLPKRKGPDKEKNTVSDVLKVILDPEISLPTFVALNIERLPPVSLEDVDMSSVCTELCSIREKLKESASLYSELCAIKEQLTELLAWKETIYRRDTNEGTETAKGVSVVSNSQTNDGSSASSGSWSEVAKKGDRDSRNAVSVNSIVSCIERVPVRKKNEMKQGKNAGSLLKAVGRIKSCDMFVSRLEPVTSEKEVERSVRERLEDVRVLIKGVSCVKLKTRMQDYASFHVKVEAGEEVFDKVMDALYDEETWPMGAVFRKFWIKEFRKRQVKDVGEEH